MAMSRDGCGFVLHVFHARTHSNGHSKEAVCDGWSATNAIELCSAYASFVCIIFFGKPPPRRT